METLHKNVIKGYELIERIGAGGFGAVYKAYQSTIGREVAIKIILPGFANHPDFIRRFEIEAHVIARLEHPHIVPLYDYWRDPEGAYLVMRWLRGGSLREQLQRDGTLEPDAVALLLDQITGGLDLAHRYDVIHRDIKPGNILLDEDGNAYLADFGIAKDLTNLESSHTGADDIVGSLDYLSPEQARSETVTPRTDIYSLGVMLYEMLVGEHPFHGASSVERLYKHINDPLPDITVLDLTIRDAVNEVIQKATQKNPDHRYADVLSFAADFRKAVQATDALASQLTQREYEVLQRIVEGLSNKQIAEELFIAVGTVKSYINQLYRKLGVRTRIQATLRAHELNLLANGVGQVINISASDSYLPEPENPYKGLRAFEAADHRDFFGREKLVEKLLDTMREDSPTARFLAVLGPSGSGKSSLVKAGLVPAIWNGRLRGSDRWFTIDMLPGAHPMEELEVALMKVAAKPVSGLNDLLWRDNRGLLRASKLVLPSDDTELVVIIDQFEEVFTHVDDEAERQQFLDILHTTVSDTRSRVRVIVTMRADFYDRPLHYPEFGDLLRSRMETILPLSAKGLERAIAGPAGRVHITFEEGLVAHIVSEMNYQASALPLLQYALTELFEQREGRVLTHEAYQHIGGAVGALAKRAETLFEEMNENHQNAARQMFLRLVTLGEGTDDTRRRTTRSELLALSHDSDIMDEVIETFANHRMLSLDHDPTTRRPTVEVAHEAILREWDRLRQWLNQSRDDIRQERLIDQAAKAWQAYKRDKSYLLTGSRLEQAEKWRGTSELALTPLENEYIQVSIQEARAREIAEAERQTREVVQEKRSRTLLRTLVAVFAMATIIAGGLAFVANNQRVRAEDSEQEALRQASIGIAALAENEAGKANAERGILLALEALEYYPYTPQAQSALLEAIDAFLPVQILDAESIGSQNAIEAAAWSPDGRYVAAAGPPIVIWDVESGSEIMTFGNSTEFESCGEPGEPVIFTFLSWSPSGESLATAVNHFELNNVYTCGVVLWDPSTGSRQLTIGDTGQAGPIWSVDWSPDGTTLLTGDDDNIAILWDAQRGANRQVFAGHTDKVWDVEFSPDGSLIATASADGSIRLWEVESGSQLKVLDGHIGEVQSIAWSPDGNRLVSGGSDGLPRIWDVQSGEVVLALPGHTDAVVNIDWSANGTRIASQSLDGTVRLWDATTGGLVLEIPNAGKPIFALKGYADFSPDSNQLLTTDTHLLGSVYLWDITSSVPLLFGHTNGGDYAAWSPDGQSIVTSSYDGTMRVWNPLTGQQVITRNLGAHFGRWGDWSPDSSRLAIPYGDLTIFDAETGETLAAIPQGQFGYLTTDWSPDGSLLVTSTMGIDPEQQTFIIDADSYEIVTTLQTDDSCVEGWPHFSPDSTRIATGCLFVESGMNTPARIWDAQTGEELMSLESEHGWSFRTLWSPDGTRMLVTYEQGVARIWDMETQEVELTYGGHLGRVWSAAWSPDGSLVATSDQTTKQVNIWDSTTGEEITSIAIPSNINTISWSPDGEYVILFGDSITEPIIKRVWASTDELIAHAYECCVTRELTSEERTQFGLPVRE